MDIKTWQGVQNLLDRYAGVTADDFMLLLYTSDSAEPVAWVSAALEQRGVAFARVWMNALQDQGFAARLAQSMPTPEQVAGQMIVLSLERDTLSHNEELMAQLAPFDGTRRKVLRAINASAALFSKGMQASPEELSARNTAVLERALRAREVRVKSKGGTDLRITLDNNLYRWISNRGSARPGGVVVLPAGEVATFPAQVDGVLVADFAFNVNVITKRDARLHAHPVTVWIENRRAVRWECDDPDTKSFLDECFEKYCVRNVGELGFGTNIGVDDAITLNSHINERRPGVHLGFGQHNQNPSVAGYECKLHFDLIARGGLVWFDDDPVPLDLERLEPSRNAHPVTPRDEDAFTPQKPHDLDLIDCCGILGCDGLNLVHSEELLARLREIENA